MRSFASPISKNARSVRRRPAPRHMRLQVETLEDRRCPAALVAGSFVIGSSILDVTDFAGSHANLTISGDSSSGGPTSMITVSSGADAITFTPAGSGALDA